MQNILHEGNVCVYFAFNSMSNYWKVEEGRQVSKIISVKEK